MCEEGVIKWYQSMVQLSDWMSWCVLVILAFHVLSPLTALQYVSFYYLLVPHKYADGLPWSMHPQHPLSLMDGRVRGGTPIGRRNITQDLMRFFLVRRTTCSSLRI